MLLRAHAVLERILRRARPAFFGLRPARPGAVRRLAREAAPPDQITFLGPHRSPFSRCGSDMPTSQTSGHRWQSGAGPRRRSRRLCGPDAYRSVERRAGNPICPSAHRSLGGDRRRDRRGLPHQRRWVRISMSKRDTIYVALLDEGIDVWRPVEARRLSPDTYLIVDRTTIRAPRDGSSSPGPRALPHGEPRRSPDSVAREKVRRPAAG